MEQRRVILFGKVQGVGLRAAAQNLADLYQIKGHAANLDDGSVEILAQGSKEKIDQFLDKLKKRPGLGSIEKIQAQVEQIRVEYKDFTIG